MKIIHTPYNAQAEYKEVQQFLIDLFESTGNFANWLPTRFENSHTNDDADIEIWRLEKKIIGMTTKEGKNHFFLHLDENHIRLLDDMLQYIEWRAIQLDLSQVMVHCLEGERIREQGLIKRGYRNQGVDGIIRVRDLDFEVPNDQQLPVGYKIIELTDEWVDSYAEAIRIVFGHSYFTGEIVQAIRSASFYRQDLDLLAIDAEGKIASFITYRMDPLTNYVELEPLGTLPNHRGLGLAEILINEGYKRLQKYKPRLIYIGGAANTPAANRVYEKTGFFGVSNENKWVKDLV